MSGRCQTEGKDEQSEVRGRSPDGTRGCVKDGLMYTLLTCTGNLKGVINTLDMFILEMRRRVEQLMSSDRPLYMFRSTVCMCGTEAGSPGSIFVRLVLFASLIGHLPNTQVDNN